MDVASVILSDLAVTVAALEGRRADVAELFGPGRFTCQTSFFDLVPGTVMDIRTGFNFSQEDDQIFRFPCCAANAPPCLWVPPGILGLG